MVRLRGHSVQLEEKPLTGVKRDMYVEKRVRQALEIGAVMFVQHGLTEEAKEYTIELYGVVSTPLGPGIVMEFAPYGSLGTIMFPTQKDDISSEETPKAMREVEEHSSLNIPRRLMMEDKLQILIQLARGIHVLHQGRSTRAEGWHNFGWCGGVLHSDVHRGNVLVTNVDPIQVKITDFGLAKQILKGEEHITQSNITTGYAKAMAPESWKGKSSRGTDVYSFGVLAWELLCETRVGASGPRLSKDGRVTIPKPLPVEIQRLLQMCLAKETERASTDRISSHLEMLANKSE